MSFVQESHEPPAWSADAEGLKWVKCPLDLWIPAGLKDFQEAWFINLIRASLRSERVGYLILCKEGCSGCRACLWRVANAHHPEHFKKHSSLVLACFNSAQIAGCQVLFFPKLVDTVYGQLKNIRKSSRSRNGELSEISTAFNKGRRIYSPSQIFFDFDSKTKHQYCDESGFSVDLLSQMPEGNHNSDHASGQGGTGLIGCAKRILNILQLPDTFFAAALAAVETESQSGRSDDDIVQHVTSEANLAFRHRISHEKFLDNFLAQSCAREILESVNLSTARNLVSRVADVVKAESTETGLSIKETTRQIRESAIKDKQRGVLMNVFYFEDFTWRSNARASKAEQRKLDNLAANAKAKELLRRQFH